MKRKGIREVMVDQIMWCPAEYRKDFDFYSEWNGVHCRVFRRELAQSNLPFKSITLAAGLI